jgi:hypothetical protein
MANTNFIVQNGLTVGTTQIFAANGDAVVSGNLTVYGITTLHENQEGTGQVQAATIADAQAYALVLG